MKALRVGLDWEIASTKEVIFYCTFPGTNGDTNVKKNEKKVL
jgi:hypothetical protein